MLDPSLEQQIAQLLVMGFDGPTLESQSDIAQTISHHGLGGVVLFDANPRSERQNIESPTQVKRLNQSLQSLARDQAMPPLLIGVDYEGGTVNRLKPIYGFAEVPSAQSLSQLGKQAIHHHIDRMAQMLADHGFNLNFAPVADINVYADNPIIGLRQRSFSVDPQQVADYVRLFVDVHRQHGVSCSLKHFPGHGSACGDSHLALVDVSDTWQSQELLPFELACGDAPMVMTAHVINRQLDPSGLPATLSSVMLTTLLRQRLRFEGVIVSDDLQMGAISQHYGFEQALVMALNAGNDLLIIGNVLAEPVAASTVITTIADHVVAGEIPLSRIERAYQRVMALKMAWHFVGH